MKYVGLAAVAESGEQRVARGRRFRRRLRARDDEIIGSSASRPSRTAPVPERYALQAVVMVATVPKGISDRDWRHRGVEQISMALERGQPEKMSPSARL